MNREFLVKFLFFMLLTVIILGAYKLAYFANDIATVKKDISALQKEKLDVDSYEWGVNAEKIGQLEDVVFNKKEYYKHENKL